MSGADRNDLLLATVLVSTTRASRTIVSLHLIMIVHVHFLGDNGVLTSTFRTSDIVTVSSFNIINSLLLVLDLLMK